MGEGRQVTRLSDEIVVQGCNTTTSVSTDVNHRLVLDPML